MAENLWQHPSQRHLWRPYEQMQTTPLPIPIAGTRGCRLQLEDGRELIDGIASWWTACHGYNHPHIIASIEKQLKTMPHVMFGGLVHDPARQLADKLCEIAPSGMSRVFFSDSGSTSVEVAMKMALQYWINQGKSGKNRFVCFRRGYHGDTIGAMSVSDPEESMHKAFRGTVAMQFVLDIPRDEYSLAEFQDHMQAISKQVAGVIIEPLAQCAEGMHFHSPDILAAIYNTAKENNMLFIADEVATGFYRTGTRFACTEAGISPDIMCIGKALTGGVVPLAATLAQEEVFEAFLSDDPAKAFMHGPTYMANPVGCAAALASLELFEQEDYTAKVYAIEEHLHKTLTPCRDFAHVKDVRTLGAIGAVELNAIPDRHTLNARLIELGVWIRPIGNVLYLMPPLVISPEELASLTNAMHQVIKELGK